LIEELFRNPAEAEARLLKRLRQEGRESPAWSEAVQPHLEALVRRSSAGGPDTTPGPRRTSSRD
jgi:hypothetical protein